MAPDEPQKLQLRSLSTSQRYFIQASPSEQAAFVVWDHYPNHDARKMSANETLVMALNELAMQHRRGFFFHLPAKSAWTRIPAAVPVERRAPQPSPEYPELVFIDFVWNDTAYAAATASTHRGRFLQSSAIFSPPPPSTPLHQIQYAPRFKSLVVDIDESLVLAAGTTSYFLLSTSQLRAIHGCQKTRGKLSLPQHLWDQLPGSSSSTMRDQSIRAFQPYAIGDITSVYRAIIRHCTGYRGIEATLTARHLESLVPRPNSRLAASVGRPLGLGGSSEPPTRRGETKKRKSRAMSLNESFGDEDKEEEH